jgi:hypothetical protein
MCVFDPNQSPISKWVKCLVYAGRSLFLPSGTSLPLSHSFSLPLLLGQVNNRGPRLVCFRIQHAVVLSTQTRSLVCGDTVYPLSALEFASHVVKIPYREGNEGS